MSHLIPEEIRQEIEAFVAEGKTGRIAMNFFQGQVLSFDVNEHNKLRPTSKKVVDNGTSGQ